MPITDTLSYPYRTVVYLTDTIGGQRYQASGVLIAPDEVLTASHVVQRVDVGTATGIRVTPGFTGTSVPFGTASVSWYRYAPIDDAGDRISGSQSQYDFAVLHLSRSFDVGAMIPEANFGGGTVHASGYPASAYGAQVDRVEDVARAPGLNLLVGADTESGTSGGPLWVMRDDGAHVVGLVSTGDGVNGYALQISDPVLAQINEWVQQDEYSNPLIDVGYYVAHNPDVASSNTNPAWHYESRGWQEGRDPNPYFSSAGYLAFNRDVAAAGYNPLDHYARQGWREARDPGANFDDELYLLHNPDVALSGMNPLLHYVQFGRAEGRAAYAAIGPSNRLLADFDPEYYLLANEDVAESGIDPLRHFLTWGVHEGRNPDAFFDVGYYLRNNPDVAASGLDPLLHFEQFGAHEGRNPSAAFNTNLYVAANPDVARSGLDPLYHYLAFGALEGRSPQGS